MELKPDVQASGSIGREWEVVSGKFVAFVPLALRERRAPTCAAVVGEGRRWFLSSRFDPK